MSTLRVISDHGADEARCSASEDRCKKNPTKPAEMLTAPAAAVMFDRHPAANEENSHHAQAGYTPCHVLRKQSGLIGAGRRDALPRIQDRYRGRARERRGR